MTAFRAWHTYSEHQRSSLLCAAAAGALGIAALVGWLGGWPLLYARFSLTTTTSTKPTAALALILAGAALALYTVTQQNEQHRRSQDLTALGCTAIWVLLAFDALAFHFAHYDSGTARTLVQFFSGELPAGQAAQMSQMGAICLLLLAIAQLLIRFTARLRGLAQVLCLAVMLACIWAVIEIMIQRGQFSGISLNAAAGYAMLALGTLLLDPPRWLDEVAFDSGPARKLFRWLPTVVLGSILLAMLLEYLAREYSDLGATKDEIYVFLFTFSLTAAFYGAARMLRSSDLRQQAELQRRSHEQRYRMIVEASHEGILLVSAEGRILYMNPSLSAMLGYTQEETLGLPSTTLVPSDRLNLISEVILRSQSTERQDLETELLRKDGSSMWALVTITSLTDESGQQIGRLSMISDLTRVRQAEEARLRLEAEVHAAQLEGVRKAVATYMHELNSPLTGLNTYIGMLQEEVHDPDQREWLADMADACRRMRGVLKSMEDLKELRPGAAGQHRGPLDLGGR